MRYHSYVFFAGEPSINMLSPSDSALVKKEFAQCLSAAADRRVRSYATLGLKADTHFMLHINAQEPADIQRLVRDLLHTSLGRHLHVAHSLLGMTRSSPYNPKHPPKESAPDAPHRYLIVYPFTKTIEWHLLPYEERRRIMKDHVDVARKYSQTISQLLLYSYGIDDQEFIVSYQMNDLEEFQSLVMELRGTEGRRYTLSDTRIYTCVNMPIEEALDMV